jgi:hypothetical protein
MPSNPVVNLQELIFTVRGQKVVLDFGLASLYGVTTGQLNQAVRRNLTRFPADFIFQLTKQELETLKSQIVISNGRSRRLAHALSLRANKLTQ